MKWVRSVTLSSFYCELLSTRNETHVHCLSFEKYHSYSCGSIREVEGVGRPFNEFSWVELLQIIPLEYDQWIEGGCNAFLRNSFKRFSSIIYLMQHGIPYMGDPVSPRPSINWYVPCLPLTLPAGMVCWSLTICFVINFELIVPFFEEYESRNFFHNSVTNITDESQVWILNITWVGSILDHRWCQRFIWQHKRLSRIRIGGYRESWPSWFYRFGRKPSSEWPIFVRPVFI